MDDPYRDAMREHLAQLAEELEEIAGQLQEGKRSAILYRATERNLQLLIEACIGIARKALKDHGAEVPTEARRVFSRLRTHGLDPTDADWNRIVGMRNALVHDYLDLDPERIAEVVTTGKYRVLLKFGRQMIDPA